MMQKIITPPYVECPDNIRCGQTIILMILKHFLSEHEWTMQDADNICGYVEDKETMTHVAIQGMIEKGFEVINISGFDLEKYSKDYFSYMQEYHGEKIGLENIAMADHEMGCVVAKKILTSPHFSYIKRDWEWSDVERLLNEGYLLLTWVDSRKLDCRNNQTIVAGHYVLVYGYSKEYEVVQFHDGGSYVAMDDGEEFECNRAKAMRVGIDYFMNAAKSPSGPGGADLTAFRLQK